MTDLRKFRIVFFLGNALLALICFLLTIGIAPFLKELGWPVQSATAFRRGLVGISGTAVLIGILHPIIIQRCFRNRGLLTSLGRATARRFNISEIQLISAIRFPWLLSLLLGLVVFAVNMLLRT